MPDVFTEAKRSQVMSRIRSRGNRDTELALAALLRRERIRGWRRQVQVRSSKFEVRRKSESRKPKATVRKRTPVVHRRRFGIRDPASGIRRVHVRPDFVFRERRVAIFVDGCFWHACPIHATRPRHNAAFWRQKLAANRTRDRRVNRALRAAGWRVLRIWEHALARRQEARLANRIRRFLDAVTAPR